MTALSYRGYLAQVAFDADDLVLVGRVVGLADQVTFHAETAAELVAAFHEAVEDYLETCAKIGKSPDKPYSGRILLRVDPSVHARAAQAAALAGQSLNAWSEAALRDAAER
jgi:predicted HicB family RNase H-like nuclease